MSYVLGAKSTWELKAAGSHKVPGLDWAFVAWPGSRSPLRCWLNTTLHEALIGLVFPRRGLVMDSAMRKLEPGTMERTICSLQAKWEFHGPGLSPYLISRTLT